MAAEEPHVHSRKCHRRANIVYEIPSENSERTWTISAWCSDDERSIREHFDRFAPKGVIVKRIEFSE